MTAAGHATPPPAHTHAQPVRCIGVNATSDIEGQVDAVHRLDLVDAARRERAEVEQLEASIRAARARLRAAISALVRAGMPMRAVARVLNYRSENSVRVNIRNG